MYRYSRSFLPRQERTKEADLRGERHDRRLWRGKGVERVAEVCKIKPASSGADFAGHLNRTHFASCSSLLVAFFGTFLCNHKKVRIICTWCVAIITRDRRKATVIISPPARLMPCHSPRKRGEARAASPPKKLACSGGCRKPPPMAGVLLRFLTAGDQRRPGPCLRHCRCTSQSS